MSADEGWVPEACTLPTAQQPLRVREFDELFAASLAAVQRLAPTQLQLTLTGGEPVAARAQELTARETECCSFFTFTITADADRVTVDVAVPPEYVQVLDALAERATTAAGSPV